MKRPQYVFRPNLSDPQHRRAWELLQQGSFAQGEGAFIFDAVPSRRFGLYHARVGVHLQRGRGQRVCHRARVRSGGVYYPPPHPRQERSDARYGVHGFRAAAAPEQGPEEAAPMFDRLGRIESETPFVLEWFVQHGIENSRVAEQRIRQESNLQKVKRVAIERLRCLIKQTSQTVMASLPSED